jgi:hypothetical protein
MSIRPATVDWWFRDRTTGAIVVAQFPNLPLWIFAASAVVGGFAADGSRANDVAGWIGTGGLAWWALDEVLRGVNPWRRVLGVGGCALVVARVAGAVG